MLWKKQWGLETADSLNDSQEVFFFEKVTFEPELNDKEAALPKVILERKIAVEKALMYES